MNDWVSLMCFAKPDKLWFVRVTSIMKAASELGLDVRACVTGIVPDMIQEALNKKLNSGQYMYVL